MRGNRWQIKGAGSECTRICVSERPTQHAACPTSHRAPVSTGCTLPPQPAPAAVRTVPHTAVDTPPAAAGTAGDVARGGVATRSSSARLRALGLAGMLNASDECSQRREPSLTCMYCAACCWYAAMTAASIPGGSADVAATAAGAAVWSSAANGPAAAAVCAVAAGPCPAVMAAAAAVATAAAATAAVCCCCFRRLAGMLVSSLPVGEYDGSAGGCVSPCRVTGGARACGGPLAAPCDRMPGPGSLSSAGGRLCGAGSAARERARGSSGQPPCQLVPELSLDRPKPMASGGGTSMELSGMSTASRLFRKASSPSSPGASGSHA